MANFIDLQLNGFVQEKQEPQKVSLTEHAAESLKKLLVQENKQGWGLKVSLTPGGCSGFSYDLDFAEKAGENDETHQSHGVDIYVDKTYKHLLNGAIIDYSGGLKGTGFSVTNPNAKSSCGCGMSSAF